MLENIVYYLTDGYWEGTGRTRRKFDVQPGGTLTVNITALTPEGQQLARWALDSWSNITDIRFQEVSHDDAHIMFDDINHDEYIAWSNSDVVGDTIIQSYVNVSTDTLFSFGSSMDSYTFTAYIHEIGHAIGLGHPGPYNGGQPDFLTQTISIDDSWQISVMSYIDQAENWFSPGDYAEPVTPMIADIMAIHELYGKPDSVNGGNTRYGYKPDNAGTYMDEFFRVWSGQNNPFFNIDTTGEHQPAFVDFDGDGDLDLVTLSPYRTLIYFHENRGTPTQPDFIYFGHLDWGSRIQDYDFLHYNNDGNPDLFILDQNAIHFLVDGEETVSLTHDYSHFDLGNIDFEFVDINGDGASDIFVLGPTGISVSLSIGESPTDYSDYVLIAEGDYSGVTDYTFDDIDGDQDYDLVIVDRLGSILYSENIGNATSPDFAEWSVINNPLDAAIYGDIPRNLTIEDFAFADLDDDGDLDLFSFDTAGGIFYFQNVGDLGSFHFDPTTFNRSTTLTIYDTGGTDWLDVRTDRNDQFIDLQPVSASSVYGLTNNVVIAHDTIIENAFAGYGDDWVIGNTGDNRLYGGYAGNDIIFGGDGNDTLWGLSGNDVMRGDSGNDRLTGGIGADKLVGGLGDDRFYFSPDDGEYRDEIVDFTRGKDRIDLSAFDTILSVQDITWYAYGVDGKDGLLDLTGHGGGQVILTGYDDDYIYDSDFIFTDSAMVA